jgi:hypothetical protein
MPSPITWARNSATPDDVLLLRDLQTMLREERSRDQTGFGKEIGNLASSG